jgi:hypothetical protein
MSLAGPTCADGTAMLCWLLGARGGGCAGPSRLSVTVIEAFEMSGKGCLLNLASTTAPDRVKSAFWTFGNGR